MNASVDGEGDGRGTHPDTPGEDAGVVSEVPRDVHPDKLAQIQRMEAFLARVKRSMRSESPHDEGADPASEPTAAWNETSGRSKAPKAPLSPPVSSSSSTARDAGLSHGERQEGKELAVSVPGSAPGHLSAAVSLSADGGGAAPQPQPAVADQAIQTVYGETDTDRHPASGGRSFRLLILNGPNLNLLGTRETELYGTATLADIERQCRTQLQGSSITLDFFQSNHEGVLVERIQQARRVADLIIINPAAYTHTSVAIRDALLAVKLPVIEVHLSNIHTREPFRRHSYISDIALGQIVGLGPDGYRCAIDAGIRHLAALHARGDGQVSR